MVNIMVRRVILEQVLEDVIWQPKSTVIINRLEYRKTEEEYGGPWRHTGDQEGHSTT